MTQSITISKANQSDAKLLESLAKEIWQHHYLPIIGQAQIDYMLNKYQSEPAILSDLKTGYTYYMAKADKIPCGYCSVKMDNGVFLSKFYVKKSYRGKGIGKKIIEIINNYAADNNANRIWLTCNKYNSESLGVYKKLGFKKIDSIVTDIGGGYVMDDYVLEKQI